MTEVKIEQVATFWSQNPCNAELGTGAGREFFEQIERERYLNEPHIPEIAKFERMRGKRVLEIGCGVGTDGRQFARAGADYTGINVDEGSTCLAHEGFELFGLKGNILQMNAEELSFEPDFFDHVYSFGVIHHSPHTEKIVEQMHRVLCPGGTVTAMVYHKNSINYRFEIMFLRKMFRYLLIPRFMPRLLARVTGLNETKLQRHRQIMVSERMTHERWVSINTDGPDCPLAKVYTAREATAMFERADFREVQTTVRFFDRRHYGRLGKLIPPSFARALGNRWGWHLIINATKPAS